MGKKDVYKYRRMFRNICKLYSDGIYNFSEYLQAENNLLLAMKEDLLNQIKLRKVTKDIREVLPELTNYVWYPYKFDDNNTTIKFIRMRVSCINNKTKYIEFMTRELGGPSKYDNYSKLPCTYNIATNKLYGNEQDFIDALTIFLSLPEHETLLKYSEVQGV